MTRTSDEWKDIGYRNIDETLSEVDEALLKEPDDAFVVLNDLREKLDEISDADEVDADDTNELREHIQELRKELKELGHYFFDQANEVSKLTSGSELRNLRGEEPHNYSTPDGGAKHDAYYGIQAMNRNFSREISWPLELGDDKWNKERAEQKGNPATGVEIEPVEATGTKKFSRKVGGRTVHIVIDERGMSPI